MSGIRSDRLKLWILDEYPFTIDPHVVYDPFTCICGGAGLKYHVVTGKSGREYAIGLSCVDLIKELSLGFAARFSNVSKDEVND